MFDHFYERDKKMTSCHQNHFYFLEGLAKNMITLHPAHTRGTTDVIGICTNLLSTQPLTTYFS